MGLVLPSGSAGGAGVATRTVAVAVLAVGLDLALFTTLADASDQVGWAGLQPPALVLAAGLPMLPVLALRRRAPVGVCAVLAAYAALLTAGLGSRPLVTLLVALYPAAVWAPRRQALAALAAVLAAHGTAVAYEASFGGAGLSGFDVLAVALVYAGLDTATFAAGRWGASAAARRRATRRLQQQESETTAALEAERLRVARELHDLVAHAVSVMVLQSAGARRLNGRDPVRAAEAMGAVEELGQQAVVELRRLLEVLRATGPTAEDDPGRHSVADLDLLLWPVQAAGIGVDVRHRGAPRSLDPGTDLTAFRVVQEALTNVVRHAGAGATATLTLSWQPGALGIEVVDGGPPPGRPTPSPGRSGYGLVGLAERVELSGGKLETGTRPGQPGFAVRVLLPTGAAASSRHGTAELVLA
ncbi:sensor histidine kinase [uncultured Friedmanniella sp.]|uniref:sensor histidine kinase n=1 Tax=uncultured Friedmanniella sp. TaxID=335381 RepID=UPI0035C96EAE